MSLALLVKQDFVLMTATNKTPAGLTGRLTVRKRLEAG
jgi:hypothetical protein